MLKHCKQLLPGLVLFPTLFVSSCAHTNQYAEPSLPESKTAVLQANVPVWIISIDGLTVAYGLSGNGKATKVASGPHIVQVSYKGMETEIKSEHGNVIKQMKSKRFASIQHAPLNFVAKPGHTYFISARRDDKKWYPILSDFAPVNAGAPAN